MQRPYLVGITGGSSSGKTLFFKALQEQFLRLEVCIISQDNYYKPIEEQQLDEQGEANFDLPESIQLNQFSEDLKALSAGQVVHRREYVFNNQAASAATLEFLPAPIIVVEGIFVFYHREIFEQLDLKLFVDADEDIKFERRLRRDTTERGIPENLVRHQWEHHVKPAYEQYIRPAAAKADVIIVNNQHFNNRLQMVVNHFKFVLNKHS